MSLAIQAQNLTLRLGEFSVLSEVSFALGEGEFLAVLGPNGAGKSSLLKLLLGLYKPSSGQLSVFGGKAGGNAGKPNPIGYIPQIKTLDRSFPALSCEVVASGALGRWPWRLGGARHLQAERALAEVGAAHLTHKPFAVLSGGELQRVYLARALVRKPRLLLLDEPAAGVDVSGESGMYQVLDEYRRQHGATVVMVTHDWGAAYHHASRVLLLNRHVIAYGPPAEALSDASLREAFGHSGHQHEMHWHAGQLDGSIREDGAVGKEGGTDD